MHRVLVGGVELQLNVPGRADEGRCPDRAAAGAPRYLPRPPTPAPTDRDGWAAPPRTRRAVPAPARHSGGPPAARSSCRPGEPHRSSNPRCLERQETRQRPTTRDPAKCVDLPVTFPMPCQKAIVLTRLSRPAVTRCQRVGRMVERAALAGVCHDTARIDDSCAEALAERPVRRLRSGQLFNDSRPITAVSPDGWRPWRSPVVSVRRRRARAGPRAWRVQPRSRRHQCVQRGDDVQRRRPLLRPVAAD